MTERARHTFYLQGDGNFLAPSPGEVAAEASVVPAPEWVNVLPKPDGKGRIYSRDYRVVYVDDLDALAKRSNAALKRQRGGGPVDADHKLYGGWFNTGGGPVIGWAEEFEARADGLYARVKWLTEGRRLIESQEYRYTSSVIDGPSSWEMSADGMPEKLRIDADKIEGFGITNIPALETYAMFTMQGDDPMLTETMKAIARKLGLADDATPEQARAAFKRFTSVAPPEPTGDSAQVETPVEEDPEVEEPPAATPVDDEDSATLRKKLDAAEARVAELELEQVTATVDALTTAGKLTPAQRKAALALASKPGGLADFRALYAAAPTILSADKPLTAAATGDGDKPPAGVGAVAWRLSADKDIPLHELARQIQENKTT